MASDLISRSALVDVFEERMQDDNVMCPVIKVLDVLEIVEDAPTVDAVEVVRCKDCKRAKADVFHENYWCFGKMVEKDHFCGYGEK